MQPPHSTRALSLTVISSEALGVAGRSFSFLAYIVCACIRCGLTSAWPRPPAWCKSPPLPSSQLPPSRTHTPVMKHFPYFHTPANVTHFLFLLLLLLVFCQRGTGWEGGQGGVCHCHSTYVNTDKDKYVQVALLGVLYTSAKIGHSVSTVRLCVHSALFFPSALQTQELACPLINHEQLCQLRSLGWWLNVGRIYTFLFPKIVVFRLTFLIFLIHNFSSS